MIFFQNKKKILCILFLFSTVGTTYFLYKKGSPNSTHLQGLGKVQRDDLIQRVTIAGQITPFRKTVITAPYHGYIKKIFVEVGDKIKKGDPVVSIVQSLQNTDQVFPIRAPYDGIVVQIQRSEGEYVTEGDAKQFILRIDDLSKLYAVASTPEMDRAKIKLKQEAIIKASALIDKTYQGIITEIGLAAREKEFIGWGQSQSAEFSVKMVIVNPDDALRPGMSVLMDVITGKKEKVLVLRHEYLHREKDQYFAVLQSGEKKKLKLGMQNEEVFEILGGLKEGDLVKQVDYTQMESSE